MDIVTAKKSSIKPTLRRTDSFIAIAGEQHCSKVRDVSNSGGNLKGSSKPEKSD